MTRVFSHIKSKKAYTSYILDCGASMEQINSLLSGYVMPLLLMGMGLILGFKMRFFYILHPIRTASLLFSGAKKGRGSPFSALSQALAGTLGVGNMSGVAAAICSGGAGAVFWMWISALVAMSIKYFEVALGQKHRRKGPRGYYGGAMYYIYDVFSPSFPRLAGVLGTSFAILCIVNSLLTGNIVQTNCAAAALPSVPPLITGAVLAFFVFIAIAGKIQRVSQVTSVLIPVLSAAYIILALVIIIPSAGRLPSVLFDIISSAFSLRSAKGGIGGYLFLRAIRFGTTRGVFSNEAGSGTSPTAHAEANAKSPHSQGCFGIFEVFLDTIVLCTLTAFVILLSDGCRKGLGGIALTVYAFSSRAGEFAGVAVGISVILFAYATVICQARYGTVALQYVTKRRAPLHLYVLSVCALCILGPLISEGVMWQMADLTVSLMTSANVLCLAYALSKGHLREILPKSEKRPSE